MIEKDVIKLIRKNFTVKDLPLKGVMKKRGNNFGFLQFEDNEQLKAFTELFVTEFLPKNPKNKIKDVTKRMNPRDFKPVKSEQDMKEESDRIKEGR